MFNHYNRVRANLARQQDAIEQQHTPEEPSEHHSSLPQDYYSNNSFIGAADIVPAERVYGKVDHISILPHSLTYIQRCVGSQQRAWLNPPTQAAGTLRDMMPAKSAYNADEEHTVYEKSNVLLIGPTGSGKHRAKEKEYIVLNISSRKNTVGKDTRSNTAGAIFHVRCHTIYASWLCR